MWNALMFGMLSLTGTGAELPEADQLQAQVPVFAEQYGLQQERVRISKIDQKHPSPFLTRANGKYCFIHINQDSNAKVLWSYLVNHSNNAYKDAFTSFSMGHELTHCLLGQASNRWVYRIKLEEHLGTKFEDNVQFEEALADVLGISHVQNTHPELAGEVLSRLRQVRKDFSSRDKLHDSSALLTVEKVREISALFAPESMKEYLAQNSK
jgi:hypothetical protein